MWYNTKWMNDYILKHKFYRLNFTQYGLKCPIKILFRLLQRKTNQDKKYYNSLRSKKVSQAA